MPDPYHLLILIVTFLVSVVLGGLIVGGIVAASLALRPFDSQWISAFGTVLAAVGTVFTLCFLIYQNASQAKEIKNERAKREVHEKKQKKMWKEQRKMLHFERAVKHRDLFEQLLNEIENETEGLIEFNNRSRLYREIFTQNVPKNDYSSYQYHLDANDLENDHIFIRENRMQNELYRLMKNPSSIVDLDDIDHKSECLIRCYSTIINRSPICGDFLNNGQVVFNVFDANGISTKIMIIGSRLKDFCGVELELERVGGFHSPLNVFKALVKLYRSNKHSYYHSLNCGHHDIVLTIHELADVLDLIPKSEDIHGIFAQAMVTRNHSGLLHDMEDKNCIESFMKAVSSELAFVNGLISSNQQKVDDLRMKIENKLREANFV